MTIPRAVWRRTTSNALTVGWETTMPQPSAGDRRVGDDRFGAVVVGGEQAANVAAQCSIDGRAPTQGRQIGAEPGLR